MITAIRGYGMDARTFRVLALLAAAVPGVAGEEPPRTRESASSKGARVSYEEFVALSTQARLVVFNRMTSDAKADLVRTHLQRWRDANANRLSRAQVSFIDERALPLIDANLYNRPMDEEKAKALEQFEQEVQQLFDRADISAAFHMIGIGSAPDTPVTPGADAPR